MHAERFDALVSFAGCDKSLPGMMMASARINLPTVFLYGGSILPGSHNGQALDIVSVFEALGASPTGAIDEANWLDGIDATTPARRSVRARHVHRRHDRIGR